MLLLYCSLKNTLKLVVLTHGQKFGGKHTRNTTQFNTVYNNSAQLENDYEGYSTFFPQFSVEYLTEILITTSLILAMCQTDCPQLPTKSFPITFYSNLKRNNALFLQSVESWWNCFQTSVPKLVKTSDASAQVLYFHLKYMKEK